MFEILAPVFLLACLVLGPVCTVFAYRGWSHDFRGKPSSSRSVIGLISFLAVFSSWVPLAVFLFLLLVHRPWADFFPTYWPWGSIILSLAGALLALALKGSSRVLTFVAGFFLALTLMSIYGNIDVIKR